MMRPLTLWALAADVGLVLSQQVYVPGNDNTTSSYPAGEAAVPSYHFTPFAFTLTETTRTATPVQTAPLKTYGPSYEEAARALPSNYSTTSWGNYRATSTAAAAGNATDNDPYGTAAFSAVWSSAGLANLTQGLYTTTVSPTPVPTSELVYPPPLYFQPTNQSSRPFPSDFILGVSGAAAQIEGAVTDEGRTPAVVDFLGALSLLVQPDTDSADDFTAIENYYLYKQDIERLAAIGMKYYSFSIAWTRILPFALPGTPVNSQAVAHYNDLINLILEKGMIPLVTLTHFDTPAIFMGGNMDSLLARTYLGQINFGYQNATFKDAFVNYGKLVMAQFADRVPYWITFNEPQAGLDSGPSVDNVLKSHAELYHFYHTELNGTGQVSLKMGTAPGVPQIPTNQSHVDATNRRTQLYIDIFLNPLALGLDYPDVYKETIQDYIPLTAEDLEYLNNTIGMLLPILLRFQHIQNSKRG